MDRRHSPDPGPLSLRVPGGRRQVAGRSRGSRRARRRVRRAELRRDCGGLLTLLLAATLAALQAAQGPDPRLERLDSISRPIVTALVDSARAVALPTEPLVQRALEGATKRATADRIVAAVRRLAVDLGHARDALGATASPTELTAAAAALRAGAPPATLTELRRIRREPLTVPLAVLTDLVASGVPVDSAAAAGLPPALRWEQPSGTLTARGTYLRFESGHRSLQGLVAGSFLIRPARRRWGGELGGSVGASRYLDFASFWHATADARLHLLGADRGVWIGATAGRTAYGAGARPVTSAGVGAWAQRSQVMLSASATRSFVGDSAYSDFLATALTRRGAVTLDASLGARVASRGGGHGVFGEASATLALGERTLLFLAAGRYPTDPVSGSVPGRYVRGGVRLRLARPARLASRTSLPSASRPAHDGDPVPSARLGVVPQPGGAVRLVLHVAGAAASVELAGDFTDWQPWPLRRRGDGMWETVLPIPSGLHRLNVRIDGGAWIVPAGLSRAADDYGDDVGILAVP